MTTNSKPNGPRLVTRGDFLPPPRRDAPVGRRKFAGWVALLALALLAAAAGSLAGLTLVYSVDLPQVSELERYKPLATTDLYDIHGQLYGSFAMERRTVAQYDDFPPVLRHAVVSIEDKNFESHWGVNLFRVAGAAYHDLTSRGRAQGASTLTMQLARNLFLTPDRTFRRKLQEVFLSIQIEYTFTKQQIFTLYTNQVYLGHGVYGFEAGSEYYFSKPARELTLPEAALLAGLPKGPVTYSPIPNPDKAFRRRNAVINAMLEDGVITTAQANDAKAAPLALHLAPPPNSSAPWFVEEVRRELERRFGSDMVHEAGLKVYTTLDMTLQQTATRAVLDGLAAYERRRGWLGHLPNAVAAGEPIDSFRHPDWTEPIRQGAYVHGLVIGILEGRVTVKIGNARLALLEDNWAWTGEKDPAKLFKVGDLVYVHVTGAATDPVLSGTLEQDSGAEGSLMAVDNGTGEVLAMVGGRDFHLSQFNRAAQAERQTGSSFKPYVYTVAMEEGGKPGDRIADTPVTFPTPGGPYTPHDYESNYLGNITLTTAFAESRNIPAVRLAARVGMRKVADVAHRFGITREIPPYLPVALGSVEVTLAQQVAAYSSFPNDGVRVTPHLLRRVLSADGVPLYEDHTEVNESTSAKTAREMMTLFEAATSTGTAAAAKALNHPLGGKTGTTSDYTDAWFLGFSPSVTCGTWVGYDTREPLGDKETGARVALPIWMDFMKAAIADRPDERFPGS